jgi:hypothetical protein
MAEPVRLGKFLFGVDRKFDGSRLEGQLLARAFNLVLGVVLKTRDVDEHTRGGSPWRRAIAASRTKGT